MWKVLICDNDAAFLQAIKKDIMEIAGGRIRRIETFNDEEQLKFYIADNPDEANIVIMDIRLDNMNGIELAEQVLEIQPNSQIIFMSGYDQYYLDVYSVEHVYFLKKPIVSGHLEKALIRAGEKIDDFQVNSLTISNKDGVHRIPYNEILYFENERRKIHIHTAQEKLSYYGKFEDLMAGLDERFKRCHNSYIVNITKARELRARKFHFGEGKVAPVSKTYYAEVRECFLEYVVKNMEERD